MSSAVVPTSAALGRPFLFDAAPEPEVSFSAVKKPSIQSLIAQGFQSTIKNQQSTILQITFASHLETRPAPEMATSGIPALDALTGGLPRGCLTEICGSASSGRTSVMLAAIASATHRGEYCALIDASDSLDPYSMAAAEVDLERMLWVRCNENSPQRHRGTEKTAFRAGKVGKGTALATEGHRLNDSQDRKKSEHRLEQVLRATDLLLESGGFGLILLDLADIPYQSARRIPLTTWFRFRRAVEHKPTILLAIEQQPIAGSCSSLQLQLGSQNISGTPLYPQHSTYSREAAKLVSPGRKPWVIQKSLSESRRVGTTAAEAHDEIYDIADTVFPSHSHLLTKLKINVELIRSRLDRKPSRSVAFETKTAWAGQR